MSKLLWALFFILVVYMSYQGSAVNCSTTGKYAIIQAEFADSTSGKAMYRTLKKINYGTGTVLDVFRSNTHIDFYFILVYTSLILLCSYLQMQNENGLPLNMLLRLNLLLAFFIALLDVAENTLILYNIRHINDPGLYRSSYWVSLSKWILSGWVVLVWAISLVKSAIVNYSYWRHKKFSAA